MGRVLQAEYHVDTAHDVSWICPVDAAASRSGSQTTEKCSSWRCRVAERCVNNNEQQRAYAHGSAEVGRSTALKPINAIALWPSRCSAALTKVRTLTGIPPKQHQQHQSHNHECSTAAMRSDHQASVAGSATEVCVHTSFQQHANNSHMAIHTSSHQGSITAPAVHAKFLSAPASSSNRTTSKRSSDRSTYRKGSRAQTS